MLQEGVLPSKVTFVCTIPICAKMGGLEEGKRLHCYILERNIACDVVIGTALVNMYGKCDSLDDAVMVFNNIPMHDVIAWNAVITMYAQHGKGKEALQLFARMQLEQAVPDTVTFVSILDACSADVAVVEGVLMHHLIVSFALDGSMAVATALVHFYGKCSSLDEAQIMFFRMSDRNVLSWNTLIAINTQQSQGEGTNTFEIFVRMLHEGVVPDKVTFISFVNALSCIAHGKQAHACLLASHLEVDVTVWNSLVTMYGKCGEYQRARQVFDKIDDRNIVSWNAMMGVYKLCAQESKIFPLFQKMQQEKVIPNEVTFTIFLTACSTRTFLTEGEQMHTYIKNKASIKSDSIATALVNMYGKCRKLKDAQNVFDEFIHPDVVLWSAIIAAYAQNDEGKGALALVEQMQQEGALPDKVTYVSILDACATQAAATEGKHAHRRICDSCLNLDTVVGTALLNMYGKCGHIEKAREIFDSMCSRSLITWNAMLSIYSMQGYGAQVHALFQDMRRKKVRPDKSTFVSVLAACSHCGLFREGRDFFQLMQTDYSISPILDHHVCMIDLFGRTGHLEEAENLLGDMPTQPTVAALMAFLGGCRYQVDVKRGERTAMHVFELDPENPAPHVMLSNIYSAAGRVSDAEELMAKMRNRGWGKRLGCSYIEVKGKVHKFTGDDRTHPQMEVIYKELHNILRKLEGLGVDASSFVEEGEEPSSHYHSEKLAMVYGLCSTPPGSRLLVTKNLKICCGCHYMFKLVSKLTNREIVVRDTTRFHQFSDGICSCADYW